MIISESRKFIFIKTSRTASTSIQVALEKFCGKGDLAARFNVHQPGIRAKRKLRTLQGYSHVRLASLVEAYFDGEDRLGEYFTCCFIRNPFTRMLSRFWGTKSVVEKALGQKRWTVRAVRDGFSEWCVQSPFRSCYEFVCYDGRPRMSYIGRFEHLQSDYERLCWLMNIPCLPLPRIHVHKKLDVHYSKLYTPAARDHVARLCRDDLEFFGYEFEKP